jgi:hypothetical protein
VAEFTYIDIWVVFAVFVVIHFCSDVLSSFVCDEGSL